MADNPFLDQLALRWEDEGFAARDIDGQLIRRVDADERDYNIFVDVTVDGLPPVKVRNAEYLKDSQGNIVRDADGRGVLRYTTIYDAVRQVYGSRVRKEHIVPTLCHLEHLQPAAVCRVCSVVASKRETDLVKNRTTEERSKGMVPACYHPVYGPTDPGDDRTADQVKREMVIHTRLSPDEKAAARVHAGIRVLLELLSADHLPHEVERFNTVESELARMARFFSAPQGKQTPIDPDRYRTGSEPPRRRDETSHFISVDHGACILCDRCSRGCNDIKHNYVIGRTGKGYNARIGFDLNDPMGHSSCVECGECMLSCPTQALTFREPIQSDWYREEINKPGRFALTVEDLQADPLLGTLPRRWLEWNLTSIVGWNVKPGDVLCNVGEYGATAFRIKSGSYEVWTAQRPVEEDRRTLQPRQDTWFTRLFGGGSSESQPNGRGELQQVAQMNASDEIFGEMSCLSSYPRNATVKASEAGVVYILRRNVLYQLQRTPSARKILDECYLTRAVYDQVRKIDFFRELSDEQRERCADILRQEAKLVAVDPGQPVFRQGEPPTAFYMVRIGHVKLSETYAGSEHVLTYLGPNKLFGEAAFVLDLPELINDDTVPKELRGRRTASATALDDVELVQVSPETFRRMLDEFPPLRQRFLESTRKAVEFSRQKRRDIRNVHTQQFVDQGLFNAQRLLVIDLENCTRCDECTKACSDTHDGVARLIRDGRRFDNFLVASSCRSCTDPYCLVGCPVDAIHRDGERLEIRIESHCIGCGLCSNNCPYGNINMVEHVDRSRAEARHKATTCDLCTNVVGPSEDVSCVYACPHHAAYRMDGRTLFDLVRGASG